MRPVEASPGPGLARRSGTVPEQDTFIAPAAIGPAVTLPEASVEARALGPRPAVALRVEAEALRRFGAADFTPALNRLPGVRLETRAPGSYRVLIRGTGRRSPFGVRDVRVYWNGLPLTEPGGDTPLNFVDPENVDRVIVGKGPFGSATGNALGGALALTSLPKDGIGLSAIGGGFGQHAEHVRVGRLTASGSLDARLTHRGATGYRAWSRFRRTTAQLHHTDTRSLDRAGAAGPWTLTTATHLLATRLDYRLPGALTPEQFADDPRQARPGSADARAAIDYETVLLGTRLTLSRARWELVASPYLTGFRFDNPFNVNHKRETNVGLGAVYSARYTDRGRRHSLLLGGEAQAQFRDARQYDPDGGRPGELQYSDDILTERLMHYAEASGPVGAIGRLRYTAGLSLTGQRYVVERGYDRGARPSSAESDFAPFLAPSVGLAYGRGATEVALRAARGSSAPTLREFRTNEGSLDTELDPESGYSVELAWRQRFTDAFDLALTGYWTALAETITTYQDATDVQRFRNSGRATQPGLELAAHWSPVRATPGRRAHALELSPSYSYQPYRYDEYAVDGVSFAGRPMPGVPRHTLDVLLHGALGWGDPASGPLLGADLNVRHESSNPLDDAGEVRADAFWLLRLQVGLQFGQLRRDRASRPYELFVAVDNLTDARYSLGNDINPEFGRRYFQPAPARNALVGARVRL